MAQIKATESTSASGILKDSDSTWNKMPFNVVIGTQFEDMAGALKYLSEIGPSGKPKGVANQVANASALSDFMGTPNYIGRPYFKDTRLGMNDGINTLWQFNRDDDIVHPLTESEPGTGIGEGRVYAQTTETNQSIAWFTFGLPRFTAIGKFYQNAVDKDLVTLNSSGYVKTNFFGQLFSYVATQGLVLAFNLPVGFIGAFLSGVSSLADMGVDKFYSLRPMMHLYYKYVDSIIAEWLIDAGMYGNGNQGGTVKMDDEAHSMSNSGPSGDGQASIDVTYNSFTVDPDSAPLALREIGVSVFDIIARKARSLGVMANSENAKEDMTEKINEMLSSETYDRDYPEWSFIGVVKDSAQLVYKTLGGATQFVGFRIEKSGADANESFSNSTAPSEFAEMVNSKTASLRNKWYDFKGLSSVDDATDAFTDGALRGLFDSAATVLGQGIGAMADTVAGGATIDVPEHYSGSDFNKSHSLKLQLRAPYGDPVSIYQSVIYPLAMLLAAALPHSVGANSYGQPFLCRVYSKGLFSIPLGIIESLSISRGSSEFGWNYNNLPLCIDVNITIKDLAAAMYLPIADKNFVNIFAANSSFTEYMLTLSGTGLYERISRMQQIVRNVQLQSHVIRNRITNPNYWASWLSESSFLRSLGQIFADNYVSGD